VSEVMSGGEGGGEPVPQPSNDFGGVEELYPNLMPFFFFFFFFIMRSLFLGIRSFVQR